MRKDASHALFGSSVAELLAFGSQARLAVPAKLVDC